MKEIREEWGSRWGFILATVGSAVGLGNIWRFPYQVFNNRSGVFLLVYFFALLTAGIPILILEFGFAAKYKGSAPAVFASIQPEVKGKGNWEWLGWLQTLIAFGISTYYTVIVGWSLGFAALSVTKGWGEAPGRFFNQFIGMEAPAPAEGSLPPPIDFLHFQPLIPLLAFLVWVLLFFILRSGVKKGIERSGKIFMPLLALMLFIITLRSLFLRGAWEGLNELFYPDFSGMTFSDFLTVAKAAYLQIFYSLSVCFSIMIAYAGYLPPKSDITNNALLTGLLDCGFSILSAIMIFAIIGNMAALQGTPIRQLPDLAGPSLTFKTLPMAFNRFPGVWGSVIALFFFLSLTFAGFTSALSILEAVIAALIDKFHFSRGKAVFALCLTGFGVSLLFCARKGIIALDFTDAFLNNIGILTCGIIEIFLLTELYPLSDLTRHINRYSDFKVGRLWVFFIRCFTPVVLWILFAFNIAETVRSYRQAGSNRPFMQFLHLALTLLLVGFTLLFSLIPGRKQPEKR